MDTRAITNQIIGQLITRPEYRHVSQSLVAEVVRETVAEVDKLLCAELEDTPAEKQADAMTLIGNVVRSVYPASAYGDSGTNACVRKTIQDSFPG